MAPSKRKPKAAEDPTKHPAAKQEAEQGQRSEGPATASVSERAERVHAEAEGTAAQGAGPGEVITAGVLKGAAQAVALAELELEPSKERGESDDSEPEDPSLKDWGPGEGHALTLGAELEVSPARQSSLLHDAKAEAEEAAGLLQRVTQFVQARTPERASGPDLSAVGAAVVTFRKLNCPEANWHMVALRAV